jgi:YesN/AraC family two-component response regulator
LLETKSVQILITDLSMPEIDGEELIENVIKKNALKLMC